MACSFRGFKRKTLNEMTTYILHQRVFRCSVICNVFPVPMWSMKWWLDRFGRWASAAALPSLTKGVHGFSLLLLFTKFISQVLQEENTRAMSTVLCAGSNRSQRASVALFPSEARSHRLRGVGALWPLAGAGLAALLSVELVVTNAVLGNQVTPAEMVHAVFICGENNK